MLSLNKKKNKYKQLKIKIRGNNMSIKNLSTNKIFEVLNAIKQNVGLAVCEFTNNQVNRDNAIENMEKKFNNILIHIDNYFENKKIKNILKIKIQLKNLTDIDYWNDKNHLENLRIDFAHRFDIPIKCIEIQIIH